MRITIISALAFVLNAHAQSTVAPKDWKIVDDLKFSIYYPDTFDIDQSGQLGMSFLVLSKQTSAQDVFRENVNLVQQDLAGQNLNLDDFVKISEEQIRTLITNGKIVSSERVKSKTSEYHQIVFLGDQGQYKLKFQQHYRVVQGVAYVLTYTAEVPQFEKYLSVGSAIMKSFQLK